MLEVLEALDDESNLNPEVGSEHVHGIDSMNFKIPLGDHDNVIFEVCNLEISELGLEIIDCLFGEVAWNIEEAISNQEVWETLLDVALDLLLGVSLCEQLGDLSPIFDNL